MNVAHDAKSKIWASASILYGKDNNLTSLKVYETALFGISFGISPSLAYEEYLLEVSSFGSHDISQVENDECVSARCQNNACQL